MRLVLDAEETFGELLYLGYSEKKGYDNVAKKRTDDLEGYVCRLASSIQEGQIEVTVPPTVSVDMIRFSQKVRLQKVEVDPYARTTEGSSFAEVVLRCKAETILDASARPIGNEAKANEAKANEAKANEAKANEKKPS